MKKSVLVSICIMLTIFLVSCGDDVKNPVEPGGESTAVTGQELPTVSRPTETNLTVMTEGAKFEVPAALHRGEGYSIYIPSEGYEYEKDTDDSVTEEKWEKIPDDDECVCVTDYGNLPASDAQRIFLDDNDDYIFEDLLGYPLCGTDEDGDTLWFHLYEKDGRTCIVSWEYTPRTDENTRAELSAVAMSFEFN